MTGTNHFLTGAAIGLSVSNPLTALPLAFVSHFVLDALPHFGAPYDDLTRKRSKLFSYVTRVDIPLTTGLLVYASLTLPWIVPLCMILALSPDFVWVYKYIFVEEFGKLPPSPKGPISQLHKDIQRYERSWGIYVEIVVAVFLAVLLFYLI